MTQSVYLFHGVIKLLDRNSIFTMPASANGVNDINCPTFSLLSLSESWNVKCADREIEPSTFFIFNIEQGWVTKWNQGVHDSSKKDSEFWIISHQYSFESCDYRNEKNQIGLRSTSGWYDIPKIIHTSVRKNTQTATLKKKEVSTLMMFIWTFFD